MAEEHLSLFSHPVDAAVMMGGRATIVRVRVYENS